MHTSDFPRCRARPSTRVPLSLPRSSPGAHRARFAAWAFACAVAVSSGLSLTACTTASSNTRTVVPPGPMDDVEYSAVLLKWTKEAKVIDHFQKQVDFNAVLLTDEMRRAYVARHARLRGDASAAIEDMNGGKLGMIVSIFTPDSGYEDLSDRSVWSVSLRAGAQSVTNVQVRRLSNKTVLEPYFPFVNRWTNDYLLVFETASAPQPGAAASEILLQAQDVSLVLRSAIANVDFNWR